MNPSAPLPDDESQGESPGEQPQKGASSEQVRIDHVGARVPEGVSPGVFSTGVIVMSGATEFALDFLQGVGHPAQVVARVVMPHVTLVQFIEALRKNLEMYAQRFGTPPELPRATGTRQPTAQEIYEELKLPDELLSGAYSNGVMISHTAAEFKFDFITKLFPHPAVSRRVFLSAPQVPRMLESMTSAWKQFQQRAQQQQNPPEDSGPGPDTPFGEPPPSPESDD